MTGPGLARRCIREVRILSTSPAALVLLAAMLFVDVRLVRTRLDPMPALSWRTSVHSVTWNYVTLAGIALVACTTAWSFSIGSPDHQFRRDVVNAGGIRNLLIVRFSVIFGCSVLSSIILFVNFMLMSPILQKGGTDLPAAPVQSVLVSWVVSVVLVMVLTYAVVMHVREWATSTIVVTSLLMVPSWLGGDGWTRFTPTVALAHLASLPAYGENRLFLGTAPETIKASPALDWLVIGFTVVLASAVLQLSIRRELSVSS